MILYDISEGRQKILNNIEMYTVCKFRIGSLSCVETTVLVGIGSALLCLLGSVCFFFVLGFVFHHLRRLLTRVSTMENNQDGGSHGWVGRPNVRAVSLQRSPRFFYDLDSVSHQLPPSYEEAMADFSPPSYSEIGALGNLDENLGGQEEAIWV